MTNPKRHRTTDERPTEEIEHEELDTESDGTRDNPWATGWTYTAYGLLRASNSHTRPVG